MSAILLDGRGISEGKVRAYGPTLPTAELWYKTAWERGKDRQTLISYKTLHVEQILCNIIIAI